MEQIICPKIGGKECCSLGVGRECLALADTNFNGKPCPFYKPSKVDYNANLIFNGFKAYWKPIRGYEGKYFVSSLGEVISSRHQPIAIAHRVTGKPYVKLIDKFGGYKRYNVADLVADAFLSGVGEVNHKDNNVLNCTATNLYRRRNGK